MKWLILLFGILSNVFASVLIKVAMMPPRKMPSLKDPLAVITNIPLWSGLFLYGMAFILYAAALRFFPLHVAHPILTSGAIAGVALLSVVMFRETLTLMTVAGILLIIAGVVLISVSHQ